MDGKKVADDLERSLWGWASALMPLLQDVIGVVLGFFRRVLLALLGGVPAEVSHEQAEAEPAAVRQAMEDEIPHGEGGFADKPVLVPRWRERVVRECLRRIGEGQPLRERHLDQLPPDVRDWLRGLLPDEADAIKHLPNAALKDEYLLGTIAEEMRRDPPQEAALRDEPQQPRSACRR